MAKKLQTHSPVQNSIIDRADYGAFCTCCGARIHASPSEELCWYCALHTHQIIRPENCQGQDDEEIVDDGDESDIY